MTRVFWQAFGLAFSAAAGGLVWLVAHMAGLPQVVSVPVAVLVFLAFSAAAHMFFAENGEPSEPQMREPWTAADKEILGEEYVPRVLRRPLDAFDGEPDDTAVFEGRIFRLTRPKGKRRAGAR